MYVCIYIYIYTYYSSFNGWRSVDAYLFERWIGEQGSTLERFIGWANNHFNILHVKHSLETKTPFDMGIDTSLLFSYFITCRLLK